MAEAFGLKRSLDNELKNQTKPVAGHCYHLRPKPFRTHKLVDMPSTPQARPKPQTRDLKTSEQIGYQVKKQKVSQSNEATIHCQMAKRPEHVSDIDTKSASEKNIEMFGSVALPNNQILITDFHNKKIKKFDSIQGTLISELQLAGNPFDITKVKSDQVAVIVEHPHQIQFVSVSKQSLQKGKTLQVTALSRGIAYNDRDQTFIITSIRPAKVEIIDMTGTVLKTLDKDSMGAQLFSLPFYVALCPDMNGMYITDAMNCSVTLLTLSGEIKAVFNDSRLQYTTGIYVHSSGLVYVVGHGSNTVHQLDPDSGEFKIFLEQKDGLEKPWNISFCDEEDKLYVGMRYNHNVKVYELK